MKIFTLAFLLVPIFSFAQIQATTTTGKKVILNQDGTWKYYTAPAPVNIDLSDCKYAVNEIDQFSGEKKLMTKAETIGKTSTKDYVYIDLRNVGGNIGFQLTTGSDLGCMVSGKSKLSVKFTDGEIIELIHAGKTDCGSAKFLSAFLDQLDGNIEARREEIVNKMKNTPIEAIRLHGSDYYTDITLKEGYSTWFQKRIPCITD